MSAYREFTGKTVEEALRQAREAFGAGLEDLDFEILTPGSRGVLGMGAEPARIVAAPRAELGGAAPKREAAAARPLPPAPPREDREDRPRFGDRDRGPRRDDRGPRRDDRGPGPDERGPRPDDRGPRRDDRDRGPRADERDRAPRPDDRGPGPDDRGPRPDDRGPGSDERGPRRDDRDRGPRAEERDRGPRPDNRPPRPEDRPRSGDPDRGPRREDHGDRGPRRDDREPTPRATGDLTEREAAEVEAARGSVAAERAELEAAEASPEALAAGKVILERLLVLMGFDVTVTVEASETSRLNVTGEGDEREALGALIGRKGERLSALQHLVNLMLSKEMGGWTRVLVDVEDYRGRRERQLREIAERAARRVVETGKMLQLEPMPALERRWVHLALRNHPDVVTQSIGEEPSRRIVVLPRPD
jgi:spoIIIJ-associated protein